MRFLSGIACPSLLLALSGCGGGGGGGGSNEFTVTAVRHVTTVANIVANHSHVDHPLLNGEPDAVIIACHNLASGGLAQYDDEPYGVWYDDGAEMWAIFHQDESAMPTGLEWNVNILGSHDDVFVHTTTGGNTVSDSTFLDHPGLNGNPSARFVVTQNWNPGGVGGVYNIELIGAYYHLGLDQWALYNESENAMPLGASFNVCIPPVADTFVHSSTVGNVTANFTSMSNPMKGGNPTANCAYLHLLGASTLDVATGLWYDGSYWAIYTEDGSPFPAGHDFFVWRP